MTLPWDDAGPRVRILDMDIECRPLSWYGGDFVTRDIIAIACRFIDEPATYVWTLGSDTPADMLFEFREQYDRADMVTGHFIRGYDLPTINAAMAEYGMAPLSDKLAHDTKLDLKKMTGLSKSQENLAAMLNLRHPKVQMSQADWRAAGRLTPEGLIELRTRVLGDVVQHIELRAALMAADLLGPPRMWRATSSGVTRYEA